MSEVIIVGGGLAGLACANELKTIGIPFILLEASDRAGGRIRTDLVDGYLLDRGFQVLLTAYPEARHCLDYPALRLRNFEAGALVRFAGRFHHVADPSREPLAALETLLAPIGSILDEVRTGALAARLAYTPLANILAEPESSTLAYLRHSGMSYDIINRFYRPFFGGIFLEDALDTSSRKFEFTFHMLTKGHAALPAQGMEAIPRQLAAKLPAESIRLNTRVATINTNKVTLTSGEVLDTKAVVIATDLSTADRLLGRTVQRTFGKTSCFYFSADSTPELKPVLILNGEGKGAINNMCVPSNIQAGYAPPGKALVSVSTVGNHFEASEADVRAQLQQWFGNQVQIWKMIGRYDIPEAIPMQSPRQGGIVIRRSKMGDGLYVAGDWCDVASSNGALASGRRAAFAIAEDFSTSRN
jgi:phytoene dehydrogenase-like protein